MKKIPTVCFWVIIGIVFVNFLVFLYVADRIGGAAELHPHGEKYYVTQSGEHVEVCRSVWLYSLIHMATVAVSLAVAIACLCVICRRTAAGR